MGRLIFRTFQCEMELDYITVSRLLLVPVAKGLWKQHCSWILIFLYASLKAGNNATHNLHTYSWDTWHPLFPDQSIFCFHTCIVNHFRKKIYLPSETYTSYKF